MIHHTDDWLTIHQGDVREVLPDLPSDSVDCIVTSPPYWGLRDYGTASWIGGDEGCDHGPRVVSSANKGNVREIVEDASRCARCGATRQDGQLGLEATPEQYVANLVGVFCELRRILKPSGTCWLNLGDSYATGGGAVGRAPGGGDQGERFIRAGMINTQPNRMPLDGLKPKDLVGIPWRVAFALQADGWWLRSDIIWAKPNPMPESVTDRPTKAHEYLFLLTKSARYFWDQEAVREPIAREWDPSNNGAYTHQNGEFDGKILGRATMPHSGLATADPNPAGRNLRSVWTIATRPYPGAHFAVFPPELPERCIKAGSSERGVCSECGAPWERVTHETDDLGLRSHGSNPGIKHLQSSKSRLNSGTAEQYHAKRPVRTTTGIRPTCGHGRYPVPATVLDPFAGSGTVGLVANRLSRRAILIDLNAAYLEQQMARNAQVPVGL